MKTRVLIVDDEAPIRLLVRINLEAEGFEVIEAPDGRAGLEAAKTQNPDVILLDIMMPFLDGWEVAEQVLADTNINSIPILFLSARADLRDQEKGLTAGAVQYITKPFNPRDVVTCIQEALALQATGEASKIREQRLETIRSMREAE